MPRLKDNSRVEDHFSLILILSCAIGLVMILPSASAEIKNGAENMELSGGSRGKVPFPHRSHQKSLGDCNICHSSFQQKPGSIEELKAKGELEQKQIMNKLCLKCHRAERTAGKPHGPTTCSKCHVKP